MNIARIAEMPVTVDEVPPPSKGVHESCLFSYQLHEYTKALLRKKVPPDVVLQLCDEIEEVRLCLRRRDAATADVKHSLYRMACPLRLHHTAQECRDCGCIMEPDAIVIEKALNHYHELRREVEGLRAQVRTLNDGLEKRARRRMKLIPPKRMRHA